MQKKNKVLLMSKKPVEDCNADSYFEPYQLQTSLENQKTYLSSIEKKIHIFKQIEIVNEKEIVEHMTFQFPK